VLDHAIAGANLTLTLSIDGDDLPAMTIPNGTSAGEMLSFRPADVNAAQFKDGSRIVVTVGGGNTTNPSTASIDMELVAEPEGAFSLHWIGRHKSQWAQIGPKLSFSRASSALGVDDDGVWTSYSSGNMAWTYANHRYGALLEPASQNEVGVATAAAVRDLTNGAWTVVDITPLKDATGVTGVTNSASTLTADANNGTAFMALTLGSGYRVTSAFVKRKTGSGTVEFTDDGGSSWTDITSNLNTLSWEVNGLTDGWTRVWIATTQANPSVGFRLGTSADEIEVDYVQVEASMVSDHEDATPYPTSPMATTRAATVLSIDRDAGGWFRSATGMLLIQYSVLGDGQRETGDRYLMFGASTANSQFNTKVGGADSNTYPRTTLGDSTADDTFSQATGQVLAGQIPGFFDADRNSIAVAFRSNYTTVGLNGELASPEPGDGYVDPASWTELFFGSDSAGANGAAVVIHEILFLPDFWHASTEDLQVRLITTKDGF